eukprot:gnl/TRDRNA2_/TRDRNA2_41832_c0_seq1.p1 gnl/TRDRNA2_/TRDRNA2_41832_c0~~gnl/TRDRNA2_/TRDRNA2_41832_c0_seq1.p1  ORF type:complete len:178 (-),score=24.13 gnl/TRDRNA2_/TRDRNA2_41832_c0_seq1:189-722(-)
MPRSSDFEQRLPALSFGRSCPAECDAIGQKIARFFLAIACLVSAVYAFAKAAMAAYGSVTWALHHWVLILAMLASAFMGGCCMLVIAQCIQGQQKPGDYQRLDSGDKKKGNGWGKGPRGLSLGKNLEAPEALSRHHAGGRDSIRAAASPRPLSKSARALKALKKLLPSPRKDRAGNR